jgi:hypothetical protein
MRRLLGPAAVLAVGALLVAGCGGDDTPDPITPEAFQAGLVQREQFTPETAACISSYLLDVFPDAQLRQLAAPDTSGVPPQVWGRYTQVVLACQYHDELGVPATGAAATP